MGRFWETKGENRIWKCFPEKEKGRCNSAGLEKPTIVDLEALGYVFMFLEFIGAFFSHLRLVSSIKLPKLSPGPPHLRMGGRSLH